jgi:hypothetical protein
VREIELGGPHCEHTDVYLRTAEPSKIALNRQGFQAFEMNNGMEFLVAETTDGKLDLQVSTAHTAGRGHHRVIELFTKPGGALWQALHILAMYGVLLATECNGPHSPPPNQRASPRWPTPIK